MKKNWKTILVAAALVGSVTGCARNATGGAFTGAALGGLAGSALTGGSTAGTLVGAVAGAAIGADVGAQLERADRERAANALRYRQDRETEVWVNPRSGVEYHYTPMEVAVEVACFAHPDDSLRRALRELGRVVYPNFVQTMIGSAIFVLAGKDFARVAKLAPKAYNVSIEPGLVTTVAKDEHHVEVQLRDVWSFPASLQVGIWEGALQACDVSGDIRVRSHSPCDVDLDIRWAG